MVFAFPCTDRGGRGTFRLLLFLAVFCRFGLSGPAQDLSQFRFFTSLDGLKESWVSDLSSGPTGTLWISHGEVDAFSRYDGYQFEILSPTPGRGLKIVEDDSHHVWALKPGNPGGFQQFAKGRWVEFPLPEGNRDASISRPVPFVPLSSRRILYLLPHALMQFDPSTRALRTVRRKEDSRLGDFLDMTYIRGERIWMTGENGIARVSVSGGPPTEEWTEIPLPADLGVRDLAMPLRSGKEEFFLTARELLSGKRTLLCYAADRWKRLDLPVQGEVVAGWRGEGNRLWVITRSGTRWDLQSIHQGHVEQIPKNRILSGFFLRLCVESGGVFWIATSNGLARHAPMPWRVPDEVADCQGSFDSIAVDNQRRVWFMYEKSLIRYDHGSWQRFPLPDSLGANVQWARDFRREMPDRRFPLGVVKGQMLFFDPDRESFDLRRHPESFDVWLITTQKDGSVLLYASDRKTVRIESYDGTRFAEVLRMDVSLGIGNVRKLWKTDGGDFWVVGHMGVGRIRSGVFHRFTSRDGYTGEGAFTMREMNFPSLWFGGRNRIMEFRDESWRTVLGAGLEAVTDIYPCRDGTVWVASVTGVHHYRDGYWLSNSPDEGLPDASVNVVQEDTEGHVWVGTRTGLRVYRPESDPFPPETMIQTRKNLSEMPPGGEVRLFFEGADRWRQTESDRLLFSHRLDGQSWSSFSEDTVYSVTGLPAGPHRFEVRAIDRNGNIDLTPAQFTFTVLVPWFRAPGFLMVLVAGTLVILGLVLHAVSRYLWMEKLVDERTREIAKRETLYRTLVDNLQQCIYLKDLEGRYLSANSSFCRWMDLSSDRIAGKTDRDIFPEELAEAIQADDRQVAESREISHSIEERNRPGGNLWIESVKTPIPDSDGNIQAILGIFWDITERKREEKEKREMETQVLQMQKMEAMGRLAGGVAHDLNNMLTPILGYAQMLLSGSPKADAAREPLEQIVLAAERARDLVRQLLVFGRKQALEMKPLDLNGVITGFEKMLRRTIRENVTIDTILVPGSLYISGDRGHLEQVLLNLAVNAQDAMPDGGALVIETQVDDPEPAHPGRFNGLPAGARARVRVSDTGTGIDPEILPHVFDPFFTTKKVGKGTGLGLATVYSIIKQHSGTIGVHSVVGEGTTFAICFPLATREEGGKKTAAPSDFSTSGWETVLLVEDQTHVRKMVCHLLERSGYKVFASPSGEAALQEATAFDGEIHLLVTDVIMTGMDGKELSRLLLEKRPGLKVLFMSGYPSDVIHPHGVLEENVNYIPKPFSCVEFLTRVRQLLNRPA